MRELPEEFIGKSERELIWTASPEVAGLQWTTVFGDPEKAGPFVVRVKIPPNIRIATHTHKESRTYTILSGEWRIGFEGDDHGTPQLCVFEEGGIYRLPALVPHFQESGPSGATIQIEAIGPSTTDFITAESKWCRI